MGRLLLSDVIHLASALAEHESRQREGILRCWLAQTRAAAKYLRRFGRPHHLWGDGSLTSRALKARAGQGGPGMASARGEFLSALSLVSAVLAGIGHSGRQ